MIQQFLLLDLTIPKDKSFKTIFSLDFKKDYSLRYNSLDSTLFTFSDHWLKNLLDWKTCYLDDDHVELIDITKVHWQSLEWKHLKLIYGLINDSNGSNIHHPASQSEVLPVDYSGPLITFQNSGEHLDDHHFVFGFVIHFFSHKNSLEFLL